MRNPSHRKVLTWQFQVFVLRRKLEPCLHTGDEASHKQELQALAQQRQRWLPPAGTRCVMKKMLLMGCCRFLVG